MYMTNPKIALDTLLEVDKNDSENCLHSLTIARYALLELAGSPLLTGFSENLVDFLPTLYILAVQSDKLKGYNSKNIDKLKEDATIWADSITDLILIDKLLKEAIEKIKEMCKASPPTDQSKKA